MVISYTSILQGISARLGASFDEVMNKDVLLWHDFLASRYRQAYEYYWFPDLLEVEQRYVDSGVITKDFSILKAVYKNDPRKGTDQQPLTTIERQTGYILSNNTDLDHVYLVYKPECPYWSTDLTDANADIVKYPGEIVIYQDFLFRVLSSQTSGVNALPTVTNRQPVDDTNFSYVRMPIYFANYLKTSVAADLQMQSGELEDAVVWEQKSKGILDDEVARITIQQGDTKRYNTYQ